MAKTQATVRRIDADNQEFEGASEGATRNDAPHLAPVEKRTAEAPAPAPPATAPAHEPVDRAPSAQEKSAETKAASQKRSGRSRLRAVLMISGLAIAVIGGGEFWLSGGRWVSTDNAYIRAPKLMVSTDVSGLVSSVDVREGERVAKGQVLFKIDPKQFQIALQSAQAQLDQTKINLEAAQQDYKRLQSDIAAQEAQVELAQSTYDRAASLLQSSAGTRAAYDQARFTLQSAQKQLESLRGQAQAALTRLGGNADASVETLPQYLSAKAALEEAQRQLDHTVVRAPFAGTVTAVDTLQPGTFLVSQTAALTNTGAVGLVSTDSTWIDANVKETDLTYTKIGDPVDVTIDAYPGRVFHGTVTAISPASGSEFSLLPAQNASGNWVKVVQRVPVRISLQQDANEPPLRAGMSVVADIDTGHKRTVSELWGSHAQAAAAGTQHVDNSSTNH